MTGGPARVLVPAALVFLCAVALRGSLPGGRGSVSDPAERGPSDTVSLVIAAALLAVSMAILFVATKAWMRRRTARLPGSDQPLWIRSGVRISVWRIALTAAGGVIAFAVLIWLLARVGVQEAPVPDPGAPATDAPPSPPLGESREPRKPRKPGNSSLAVLVMYVASAAFLVLMFAWVTIAHWARRERSTSAPARGGGHSAAAGPGADSLMRAAEVGLAEVGDLTHEPRKAIIACYAAMERELARFPGVAPQDFDTASEVLARAVEHDAVRPDSATPLVDLFEEARFSRHVMDEGDRQSAVSALRRVLADLKAPT